MNQTNIFVSIVIVCRNNLGELTRTIRSLDVFLKNNSAEIIIVDANSIDGTKEFLEKLSKTGWNYSWGTFSKIKWISEPDVSPFDGMNKGARLCDGFFIWFLNSGDEAHPDFLRADNLPLDVDVIYGRTLVRFNKKEWIEGNAINGVGDFVMRTPLCHQSVLIKKDLVLACPYNLKRQTTGDYEFFLTAYRNGKKFFFVPQTISIFYVGGISSNREWRIWWERILIALSVGNVGFQVRTFLKGLWVLGKLAVKTGWKAGQNICSRYREN